jgi:hypothetical protein
MNHSIVKAPQLAVIAMALLLKDTIIALALASLNSEVAAANSSARWARRHQALANESSAGCTVLLPAQIYCIFPDSCGRRPQKFLQPVLPPV